MSHKPFSGVITALITPFTNQNEVDVPALNRLIDYQKKSGINGLVILGTTAENPTLSESEAEKIVQIALEYRSSNFHIYVGTGTNDTSSTIEKSVKFANLKSPSSHSPDGIMVVTPYYNKPNQRCLLNHYNKVAQAISNTPLCIYNVPGRTGINMLPTTLAQITLQNENIVAIKEAAGNVNAISEMRIELNKVEKKHFRILSGDDATFAPSLLAGSEGVISVTTHIIPRVMLNILKNFVEGNVCEMQKLHLESYCLNSGLFALPNPIGVKFMLSHYKLCENTLRAPLYSTDKNEAEIMLGILAQLEQNNIKVLA